MIGTRSLKSAFSFFAAQWRVMGMLAIAYLAVFLLATDFIPSSAQIYPAMSIALVALFFGGTRIWPAVFVAAFAGPLIVGAPLSIALIGSCAVTLQAVGGAWILRTAGLDPLFRRYVDMLYLLTAIALISVLSPTGTALALMTIGRPYPIAQWYDAYVAAFCVMLIVAPFLLRWFAKPQFSRLRGEILETIAVFALLCGIDVAVFVGNISTVLNIPLLYFVLVPLFWISLRLRPRFLTLALLITTALSLGSAIAYSPVFALTRHLFSEEIFLIALSTSFFIVVSLEEERRVNSNKMRSQLSMLENAMVRVRQESQAKNDFIAILAHELRNPLAPVLSGIDLLKLKGPRDEDETETLAMMDDRMGTVRRLLDDLLDISRISEGKVALTLERLNLETIVRRAILSTDHYRKERHQSLAFRPPERPLAIEGDAVRIEQIFSNLLGNASKYSNSGDKITIIMQENSGTAEVRIIDEGLGLRPEVIESIFMPFQQIDHGERSKNGLGIGLALVKTFAEMHGGSAEAHSAGLGKGSVFIIRLPLTP